MGRVRGKPWMQEHVSDRFVQRARAEGMRSRAAYKLAEIDRRDGLLRTGMTVVDLGAAPGGWSQVAAQRVGAGGRVVAVDILDMQRVPGVDFIRGDFREAAVLAQVEQALAGAKADLVLSDMSPNISGIAGVDQARSLALAELALEFSVNHLKPHGNLLVKVFQGTAFEGLLRTVKRRFGTLAVRKPEASRGRSSEMYLVAKGLKL